MNSGAPSGETRFTQHAAWIRHTVSTLAYRAEKVLRDVPEDFASFRASAHSRPALALVAHLGDLMEWGVRMTQGERAWRPIPQSSWAAAVDRFFAGLAALDEGLATADAASLPLEQVFQGPIADALTHIGQLALMRGMVAAPVRPESYARAHIAIGRVGRDQEAERAEFDADASPQSSE